MMLVHVPHTPARGNESGEVNDSTTRRVRVEDYAVRVHGSDSELCVCTGQRVLCACLRVGDYTMYAF